MSARHIYIRVEERHNLPKHHVYVRQPSGSQYHSVLDVYGARRVEVVVYATLLLLVLDFVVEVGYPGGRYGQPGSLYGNQWKRQPHLLQVLEYAVSVGQDHWNLNRGSGFVLVVL